MKWELEPKMRVDLVCYGGINLSGERRHVNIQAVAGRHGPDVAPEELKSLVIVAPLGTLLVLKTWDGDDWEAHAWRAVRLIKGSAFKTQEGGFAARLPDLDWLDKVDARRTDPDSNETYPFAATLKEGNTWTFGRSGDLKGKIQVISITKQ